MSTMLEGVLSSLGTRGLTEIASAIGAPEGATKTAIGLALPAILGSLANNAKQPEGATSLRNALDEHDASIFGQLGGLLAGGGDGAAILGHVLGSRRPKVEAHIAEQSGVSPGLVQKLLPILAPLVMGYLANRVRNGGLGADGTAGLLERERREAEAQVPALGGMAALIDDEGDGIGLDDVLDIAQGKGALGGLLGGLLKR